MAAPVVIWNLKPSLLSIVTRPLYFFFAFSALAIAAITALNVSGADSAHTRTIVVWVLIVFLVRIIVESLIWYSTSFTLTSASITTRRGVLRRSMVEIPLEKIQHLELFRSLRERLIGAGTLGIGTGAGIEAVIDTVSDPQTVLSTIRARLNLAAPAPRPPVIGLVGSIGAGKSTLAGIFKDRGCLVMDSDGAAKQALTRPDVIASVSGWWGKDLLDTQGQIDRRKLADLVFADPAKRKQLEGLTHPLLKTERAARIAQCRDVPAIIIDAPLLFEAGVDAECDYVICVDAPRALRVERVAARSWTDAELAKRESAQLSMEEKRRRSTWVIENTGTIEELARQADDILRQAIARHPSTVKA